MNETTLGFLTKCSKDDFLRIITEFNSKNSQTMVFDELKTGDLRRRLWMALFERLNDGNKSPDCDLACLESIRILSRDAQGLDDIFSVEMGKTLTCLAGLSPISIKSDQSELKVVVEAQKCLCNLIYNSLTVQRLCCVNGCVDGIAERLKTFKDQNLIHDIKFFDMKMLFLMTALCADVRSRFKTELHGMIYLIELLALLSKNNHGPNEKSNAVEPSRNVMEDQIVDLVVEVLKILFNLTVDVDKGNVDEDDEIQFSRLVSILRELLLCATFTPAKRQDLQSHTVNLLTNLPFESCVNLVKPLLEMSENSEKEEEAEFDYEGHNVEAIDCLLNFLEMKLEKPGKSLREAISPILICLIECSRSNRIVRKYLRSKILPPLKDVYTRPEEGETSRNKLCRLLTHPVVEDLVAELLFVLCKENVGRLIKYSGYGNAAGLLATRGLVLSAGENRARYSSESEDSETEEYRAAKDNINPVIGCYDEPKPDLMAGMTEEQKEYEVMQLVNMMNKITETGVVTPMQIDQDGKLKPVEHVLALREEGFGIKKQQFQPKLYNSDSD